MKGIMHDECIFQASPFFRDVFQAFIECASVSYLWDSTEYTPKVTSVQPRVLLMAKIKELMIFSRSYELI